MAHIRTGRTPYHSRFLLLILLAWVICAVESQATTTVVRDGTTYTSDNDDYDDGSVSPDSDVSIDVPIALFSHIGAPSPTLDENTTTLSNNLPFVRVGDTSYPIVVKPNGSIAIPPGF